MGRSVASLTDATKVVYKDVSNYSAGDWRELVEDIQEQLKDKYPSLEEADGWDGNETSIILENNFVEIGISEYCGLASISVRINDELDERYKGLAERFIGGVELAIEQFGDLRKLGNFSNGEGVYESISA